jgi:hypothetical protein
MARDEAVTRGLDAVSVIVLAHTNLKGDKMKLQVEKPAPKPGEPLSYERFLQQICKEFGKRFS